MKILGFVFNCKPTVHAHVHYISSKFNRSLWSLVHLKRSNIDTTTLVKVYSTMLRPLAEYCAPLYHSMLTAELAEKLEGLQKRALKIIFGFGFTYNELLLKSKLEKMSTRRAKACLEYAKKLSVSPRFNNWFQEDKREINVRNKKKYVEEYAKTNRLYNSPLFYMRRKLNELHSKEDNDCLESTLIERRNILI